MGENARVRCVKTLYKSTYRRNAFVRGREYEVTETTDLGVHVRDEEGNDFGPFVPSAGGPYYVFAEYFVYSVEAGPSGPL